MAILPQSFCKSACFFAQCANFVMEWQCFHKMVCLQNVRLNAQNAFLKTFVKFAFSNCALLWFGWKCFHGSLCNKNKNGAFFVNFEHKCHFTIFFALGTPPHFLFFQKFNDKALFYEKLVFGCGWTFFNDVFPKKFEKRAVFVNLDAIFVKL